MRSKSYRAFAIANIEPGWKSIGCTPLLAGFAPWPQFDFEYTPTYRTRLERTTVSTGKSCFGTTARSSCSNRLRYRWLVQRPIPEDLQGGQLDTVHRTRLDAFIAVGWNGIAPGWMHSSQWVERHRTGLETFSNPVGTTGRTQLDPVSHPVGCNVALGWKKCAAMLLCLKHFPAAKVFLKVFTDLRLYSNLNTNNTPDGSTR